MGGWARERVVKERTVEGWMCGGADVLLGDMQSVVGYPTRMVA